MSQSGGDIDGGEGCACVGWGYMGTLRFPKIFCEPKTVLKTSLLEREKTISASLVFVRIK